MTNGNDDRGHGADQNDRPTEPAPGPKRALFVDDSYFRYVLLDLVEAGHAVFFIYGYDRPDSPHELDGYEVRSWLSLTDELINSMDVVFMDGMLSGWRKPGTDRDLTGIDLVKELRQRGFAGKIFGRSASPLMNKNMIDAGADGESNLFVPSLTINRAFA